MYSRTIVIISVRERSGLRTNYIYLKYSCRTLPFFLSTIASFLDSTAPALPCQLYSFIALHLQHLPLSCLLASFTATALSLQCQLYSYSTPIIFSACLLVRFTPTSSPLSCLLVSFSACQLYSYNTVNSNSNSTFFCSFFFSSTPSYHHFISPSCVTSTMRSSLSSR